MLFFFSTKEVDLFWYKQDISSLFKHRWHIHLKLVTSISRFSCSSLSEMHDLKLFNKLKSEWYILNFDDKGPNLKHSRKNDTSIK